MGARRDAERGALLAAADVRAHLLARSNLPGPRANLELLDAAGDLLPRGVALELASLAPGEAPSGSALEFLPCCGLVAIGRLVADGEASLVALLRDAARDERWRVREAVAIALQRWGDAELMAMTAAIRSWASASPLEARAAVAAICEPRLLRLPAAVEAAVGILEDATGLLETLPAPRGEPGRVLGAALGYAWSVAVAADPPRVLPAFEKLAACADPDIRRVVRTNLRKGRFTKAAPEAVARLA